MITYHKAKERFGQTIENRDEFIKNISFTIKKYLNDNDYDFIIYPESSSDFIEKIVNLTGIPSIKVYKNDIDVILNITNSMKLQKMERGSHIERIKNMAKHLK